MQGSLYNPPNLQEVNSNLIAITSQTFDGNNGSDGIIGINTNSEQIFVVVSVLFERLDQLVVEPPFPIVRLSSDGTAITENFDCEGKVGGTFYKLGILDCPQVMPLTGLTYEEVQSGQGNILFRFHILGYYVNVYTPS